jgi:hypothetical protein
MSKGPLEFPDIYLMEKTFDAVADTMAVVLHLDNRKMPTAAKAWFQAAETGEKLWVFPR